MTRLIALLLDVLGGVAGVALMMFIAAFFATGGEVVFWIEERVK
jgi:hypothetical protein